MTPLIETYERFATMRANDAGAGVGRAELPGAQPATRAAGGSAVPLVWAHAEYLKLLRSAVDGKVFDRIDPVYERYCEPERPESGAARSGDLHAAAGPFRESPRADTLRILDEGRFEVVWTAMDGRR